jgi:hypothetical protein
MVERAHIGSTRRYSIGAAIVCNAINAVGLSVALPLLSVTLDKQTSNAALWHR